MTTSTLAPTAPIGGPTLTQKRELVTAIPGPRSLELLERKKQSVAAAIGITLPVFVEAAGVGVVRDLVD